MIFYGHLFVHDTAFQHKTRSRVTCILWTVIYPSDWDCLLLGGTHSCGQAFKQTLGVGMGYDLYDEGIALVRNTSLVLTMTCTLMIPPGQMSPLIFSRIWFSSFYRPMIRMVMLVRVVLTRRAVRLPHHLNLLTTTTRAAIVAQNCSWMVMIASGEILCYVCVWYLCDDLEIGVISLTDTDYHLVNVIVTQTCK